MDAPGSDRTCRNRYILLECEIEKGFARHADLVCLRDDFRSCANPGPGTDGRSFGAAGDSADDRPTVQLESHDELSFLEVEGFERQGSASGYCSAVCMPILNRHDAQLSLDKSAEMTWPQLISVPNRATVWQVLAGYHLIYRGSPRPHTLSRSAASLRDQQRPRTP